jgi:hypothetical protein
MGESILLGEQFKCCTSGLRWPVEDEPEPAEAAWAGRDLGRYMRAVQACDTATMARVEGVWGLKDASAIVVVEILRDVASGTLSLLQAKRLHGRTYRRWVRG